VDADFIGFMIVVATMATVGFGGYAAIRFLNILLGRMEGRGGPEALAELADLRARVEELEAERGRMVELEERVDFTERVLAGDGQARRLEGSP
jgi:hypothetical protein